MRRVYLFIFIILSLLTISCQKVSELSDQAAIENFEITNLTKGIVIDQSSIRIENNTVILPLTFGRKLFPLTLSADVRYSGSTTDVLAVDRQHPIDFKQLKFENVYEQKSFYLIAESGIPHLWNIRIEDKPNAEITDFKVKEISSGGFQKAFSEKNYIYVMLSNAAFTWPLKITPEIQKTPAATYKDGEYEDGDVLEFTSYNDIKKITLVADNQDEREWFIQLVSPTPINSDFDHWINTDPTEEGKVNPKINIDPMPGVKKGWATANNTYVIGSVPYARNGGFAAQLTTSVQDLNFIGLGDLIASGTLYTGYFKLNLQLDNPRSMTFFGIPFMFRPDAVELDAQYIAGAQLQQSVKSGKKYSLVNLPGKDKGHIWIKLFHLQGSDEIDYHSNENIQPGLTILGEGEHIFNGDPQEADWNKIKIKIQYKDRITPVTHIAIVMTSSKEGDTFKGAIGSVLRVDNLNLIYE